MQYNGRKGTHSLQYRSRISKLIFKVGSPVNDIVVVFQFEILQSVIVTSPSAKSVVEAS